METKQVSEYIGKKIRDLRNRNGLTLQELADRSELTKGFLSQLERGQVSPSVTTLWDLIECLGSTPSEFFREEEEQVVFSEEQYFEKIDESGNRRQWIIPSAQKYQMEPLLVELASRFHRFYTSERIKGEAPELCAARLKLADSVRSVIAAALGILGVSAPVKM